MSDIPALVFFGPTIHNISLAILLFVLFCAVVVTCPIYLVIQCKHALEWRRSARVQPADTVADEGEPTCMVCCTNRCTMALIPCGHIYACGACHALDTRGMCYHCTQPYTDAQFVRAV